MLDQDPALVVDDQELEPARQHRVASGQHHLQRNVTTSPRWRAVRAARKRTPSPPPFRLDDPRTSLASPPNPPGSRAPARGRAPGAHKAAMARKRDVASGSFHAAT